MRTEPAAPDVGASPGHEAGTAFAITLMEHLVVPTFVLDAQRRVLIWNRACECLTGIGAGELLGTSDHWRAFYDRERPCLADLVATGEQAEIDRLYTVHVDPAEPSFGVHAENWCVMPRVGRRLYLAVDAGPIFDATGRLLAVVETLRDMTDRKNAEDALQRLANRDGLTGLDNRRSFDAALATEWRRARRQQTPLALIMFDVDRFKRYNDAYGHPQGDACLRAVAAVLAAGVHRAGDLAARYGGEEFALLLPNTDAAGALIVAERVRAGVQALALAHGDNGDAACVTISAGAAALLPHGADGHAEDLVRRADAALYRAKHAGRNRVVGEEDRGGWHDADPA